LSRVRPTDKGNLSKLHPHCQKFAGISQKNKKQKTLNWEFSLTESGIGVRCHQTEKSKNCAAQHFSVGFMLKVYFGMDFRHTTAVAKKVIKKIAKKKQKK
jgi:FPC/CPF motif-containing protein YcgG